MSGLGITIELGVIAVAAVVLAVVWRLGDRRRRRAPSRDGDDGLNA
jgi:hypothetical protein